MRFLLLLLFIGKCRRRVEVLKSSDVVRVDRQRQHDAGAIKHSLLHLVFSDGKTLWILKKEMQVLRQGKNLIFSWSVNACFQRNMSLR